MSTKKVLPKTAAKEPDHVIYCGPSLPARYGLRQYTVFLGPLPGHVQQLIEKCPAIKALMVPVAELAAVKTAMQKVGSVEAVMYNEIKKSF